MICNNCGWSDSVDWQKNLKKEKYKSYLNKVFLVLAGLLIVGFAIQHQTYKGKTLAFNFYSAQMMAGIISPSGAESLGNICFEIEKFECAAKAYNKAVTNNTQSERPFVLVNLGKSLTEIGQYQEAVGVFELVEDNTEAMVDAYQSYGLALQNSDLSERAIKAYYSGLTSSQLNDELVTNLVNLLKESNKYTDAISVIGSYLYRFPRKTKEWNIKVQSLFVEAEKTEPLYNSEQVALAGVNKKFHIPVEVAGIAETQMYMISEKSAYMTINGEVAKKNRLNIAKRLGTIKLMTQMGREIRARRVLLSQVRMGPWLMRNVQAVICDNCAPVIGRTVLKKFKWSESKIAGTDLLALNIK